MKVLFILQSIGYGGSMTSLINLVTLLKEKREIEFDVLFMDPYGELYDEANREVSVCSRHYILESSTMNRKNMLRKKLYGHYLLRLGLAFLGIIRGVSSTELGFGYAAKRYDNKYDCIIAYQESVATNFAIRIKAKKHIAWVHNDYENVLEKYEDKKHFYRIYSLYNRVVCVSKTGAEHFIKQSGLEASRITYIHNPLLVDSLKKKSTVPIREILDLSQQKTIIEALESSCLKMVSSGRFVRQKRFDRVIRSACILRDRGYEFKWFILGSGELFDEILVSIKDNCLEEYVYLTGGLINPFPIVKTCDLFILTSEFEAHPMVLNEALILGTPVITTNFESASEVVIDEITGLICEMYPESIVSTIQKYVDNPELRYKIKKEVNAFTYSNDSILDQVIDVILH